MNENDYRKVLQHLEAASRVLIANQGELTAEEVRLRHLLSLTASEARRRVVDAQARPEPVAAEPVA